MSRGPLRDGAVHRDSCSVRTPFGAAWAGGSDLSEGCGGRPQRGAARERRETLGARGLAMATSRVRGYWIWLQCLQGARGAGEVALQVNTELDRLLACRARRPVWRRTGSAERIDFLA